MIVSVDTTYISQLQFEPFYYERVFDGVRYGGYYAIKIDFRDDNIRNFCDFKVGKSLDEALKVSEKISNSFKDAHICENSRIAVLIDKNSDVLAIGAIGKDYWLDASDNFSKKTFKELNLKLDSLVVY